jgi:hypothetical protein
LLVAENRTLKESASLTDKASENDASPDVLKWPLGDQGIVKSISLDGDNATLGEITAVDANAPDSDISFVD